MFIQIKLKVQHSIDLCDLKGSILVCVTFWVIDDLIYHASYDHSCLWIPCHFAALCYCIINLSRLLEYPCFKALSFTWCSHILLYIFLRTISTTAWAYENILNMHNFVARSASCSINSMSSRTQNCKVWLSISWTPYKINWKGFDTYALLS